MTYLKIDNFFDKFNTPQYKGLDINQFVPNSQQLGDTYCIIATNENITNLPSDVVILSEGDYISIKNTLVSNIKSNDPVVKLQEQNAQIILALVNGGLM